MKVVILCGGKGIRAFPFTEYLPKPMLPVAGSPIIVQVIRSFIRQGFTEFILAAGYRMDVLVDYFEGKDIGASVTVLNTGMEADTGERVLACKDHVGDQFIVTYGDGLCDVPMRRVVELHNSHDGVVTVTSVPMYSQYGVISIAKGGSRVTALEEKPLLGDKWINAGFIVFDRTVFDHWEGTNMEQHLFPALVKKGLMHTYSHRGFFKSLDSYKDQMEFSDVVDTDNFPWLVKE